MLLVGQRLHISHDHHLIRSWGIRHAKRFDVDEVLYQHCVKKLLVGYLTPRARCVVLCPWSSPFSVSVRETEAVTRTPGSLSVGTLTKILPSPAAEAIRAASCTP